MELDREYARIRLSEAALRNAATVFDETYGKPRGLGAQERNHGVGGIDRPIPGQCNERRG